eukprot:53422-Prymnesium_polylepis.1
MTPDALPWPRCMFTPRSTKRKDAKTVESRRTTCHTIGPPTTSCLPTCSTSSGNWFAYAGWSFCLKDALDVRRDVVISD